MIKTRFAPSPTGYLHIGGARTALFCWLFAHQQGGQFVLRIEDTDRQRSTPESIAAILDAMQWLNLDYDEGPYYQTDRFDRYQEIAQRLLDQDQAYHCYCSREELDAVRAKQLANKQKPRYNGRCRDRKDPPPSGVKPLIRFKNPLSGAVEFEDMVRGRIVIDNNELDDLVIVRPDGSPTYNFCVVVDDLDMGITHVVRGDDHVNNTPRQINIFRTLGADLPKFGHVPMILGADGSRLSKRHGAVSVMQYRDEGYLPEALLNYLVRLGWSHQDQEIFSRKEMVELFRIEDVNRAASTFNPEKLDWLNQQYLIGIAEPDRLATLLGAELATSGFSSPYQPPLREVVNHYRERGKTIVEMAANCSYIFQDRLEYDGKPAKALNAESAKVLIDLRTRLDALEAWQTERLHETVQASAEALQLKFGKVGGPLRAALTAGAPAPGIDATLALIGKEKSIRRINDALAFIAAQS